MNPGFRQALVALRDEHIGALKGAASPQGLGMFLSEIGSQRLARGRSQVEIAPFATLVSRSYPASIPGQVGVCQA